MAIIDRLPERVRSATADLLLAVLSWTTANQMNIFAQGRLDLAKELTLDNSVGFQEVLRQVDIANSATLALLGLAVICSSFSTYNSVKFAITEFCSNKDK